MLTSYLNAGYSVSRHSEKQHAHHLSEGQQMVQRTLDWMQGLRVTGSPFGRFNMSASTDDTIFTSCFAVFIYDLLGEIDKLTDTQRLEWLEYILSFQDEETGLFIDPDVINRNLEGNHDMRYVSWQLTTFCLSAVNALGGELRYPLIFLKTDGYKTPEGVKKVLDNLNWSSPWNAGNLAMFLGIMLICDAEQRGEGLDTPAIQTFFDWHDAYQNPRTGFWGEGKASEYHNGLFGAYHQYLLYFYVNRDLHCKEVIIDRTLAFQNIDGMFAPQMGGGGCEDIDAVDTLVQLYLRTKYQEDKVQMALEKVYKAVCDLEQPGGGFIWGIRKRYGPLMYLRNIASILSHRDIWQWMFTNKRFIREQQLDPLKPRHPQGWVTSGIPVDESDLFSTWFRLLVLAYCSMVIKTPYSSINWHFLKTPGLGWFGLPEKDKLI